MGLSSILVAHGLIAHGNFDARIYCVDTWQGSPQHQHLPDIQTGSLYHTFAENVRRAQVGHFIRPIRCSSSDAAANWSGPPLDIVFIDGDLSRWMQWLLTAHVRRYHRHYGGSGHVWQGRFKAFPIQEDEHLLAVLRYVERNALRANLVGRAQDWPYSSLALPGDDWPALDPGPVPRGRRWLQHVNRPQTDAELKAIRHSLTRGTPYGSDVWMQATARQLGLESTLRPRGRPRKSAEK
jgi:hypothetical protein